MAFTCNVCGRADNELLPSHYENPQTLHARRAAPTSGSAGSRTGWLASFSGAASLVIEMRIFTKESLEQELRDAGFSSIEFDRRECAEFGIVFPYQWNYPILARKIR